MMTELGLAFFMKVFTLNNATDSEGPEDKAIFKQMIRNFIANFSKKYYKRKFFLSKDSKTARKV